VLQNRFFTDWEMLTGPALNGYESVLNPKRSVRDVCYWMNDALVGTPYVAINTSVEVIIVISK
jgi:hypothetical protein